MKVTDVTSGKSVSAVKKTKKASGKGGLFAESMKEAASTAESTETAEPSAVGAVGSVLAVQEAPDATEQRSRGLSLSYGAGVLDRLEDIRRDLLTGAIPKEKMTTLAQTMRSHRKASKDEKLNEILDEIELRAEVEIAKLTRDK